jgi:PAS domain S-box-containing protein
LRNGPETEKPYRKAAKTLALLSRQAMRLMELSMSMREVEQSETKLKAIFDSSESSHVLIDREMRIIAFNKAADLFASTLHGKLICCDNSVLEYIGVNYHQVFMKLFRMALNGKRVNKEVLINYDVYGHIWWSLSFIPVKDNENNIIGVSFNATDINERKQQQEKIIKQNNVLSRVAYIQSHEFRRPVASILGLMELIRHEDYNPPKEYYLMMEAAVEELDQKIHDASNHSMLEDYEKSNFTPA